MERSERQGFSGFDVLLGVGVLIVVAASLPWLGRQLDQAKSERSRDHASRVAQVILDYHTERGQWPAAHGQTLNLAELTAPPPSSSPGTMVAPAARPWIGEVPVDSWGRPFVAAVYEQSGPAQTVVRDRAGSRAYPMAPPPGATIVVVSAGQDGILQSDLDALASLAAPTYLGDDTGQVLHGRTPEDGI